MPLQDTIQICSDALYRGHLGLDSILETLFLECMCLTTKGVEFSFNNIMYAQTDGVSMGSPLGPILANIFVGFHVGFLFV